ncbi:hypothetical protein THS27_08700 [Thalassospira sp. MCCC 1A01428]|nr:hypothetical protein THS27_08700 [Thalassospira sp. MCCC 1A01428]
MPFRYENYLHLQFYKTDFCPAASFAARNTLIQVKITTQAIKATAFLYDAIIQPCEFDRTLHQQQKTA